jgi:hypothetical protein
MLRAAQLLSTSPILTVLVKTAEPTRTAMELILYQVVLVLALFTEAVVATVTSPLPPLATTKARMAKTTLALLTPSRRPMALLSVVSAHRTRTVPLQQPALLPALLKRLPLQVYLSALLQDLICPTIRRMAPHSSTFPLDTTKVVLRLSNALIAFLAVLLLRPSV